MYIAADAFRGLIQVKWSQRDKTKQHNRYQRREKDESLSALHNLEDMFQKVFNENAGLVAQKDEVERQ